MYKNQEVRFGFYSYIASTLSTISANGIYNGCRRNPPVRKRLIGSYKLRGFADYGLIVHMGWHSTEAVILRYGRHCLPAVVLPQSFGVPCDTFLYTTTVHSGLVHNLVEGSPHTDEFFLFCYKFCRVLCRRQTIPATDLTSGQSCGIKNKTLIHKSMQNKAIGTER